MTFVIITVIVVGIAVVIAFNPIPTKPARGLTSVREETLQVRLEDKRLKDAWLQAETEEDRQRIEDLIDANLSRLIEIERRYFGT